MAGKRADYYSLLGVLRDASLEQIKRAYFDAAQKLHPDKNTAPGETEIFLEIQQAYEVLSNPKRRAQYDATLPKDESSASEIQYRVLYSRPSLVHLSEPQLIYVLLEAGPRAMGETIPAPPLNVCLVLDRSTSMKGEKIDMVKAAATQLMRNLRPHDIFSVVAFSDRAEVLIPAAYQSDRDKLPGRIQMLQPGGATELFQGLEAGYNEVRRSLDPARVNHIVLLTDGHTYGDEQACIQLAEEAARQNVGISGMGIGGDWNDIFLDTLASQTGGSSAYISQPQDIQRLLIEKFHSLANIFAEDMQLEYQERDGIQLNYAFRLQPEGGLVALESPLRLGPILQDTALNVLFEFVITPAASQAKSITLLDGLLKPRMAGRPTAVPPFRAHFERPGTEDPGEEPPPTSILRALSRLTLYRLQERAREDADAGRFDMATQHLKNLASHLLSQGEPDLAKTALLEAEHLERVQSFSQEGSKEIKYGTRALLLAAREAAQ
jgi:Ca-activated chloride channel family protein